MFSWNFAVPEIRHALSGEDMGIPKILPTCFIGTSKKSSTFFGHKGKEDMGILNNFEHYFLQKMEIVFDIKVGIPIFYNFFESLFFKDKIQAFEFSKFLLKMCLSGGGGAFNFWNSPLWKQSRT